MNIILASQSPFRKKALDIIGLQYSTVPSNFDEESIRDPDHYVLAKKLSEAKARAVGEQHPNSLIIAGDLFCVFNNKIFEKPKSEQEAFDMLKTFSGGPLLILTGLAVYNTETKSMQSTVESTTVHFRTLIDKEIQDYISKYPVTTFSGAFEGDAVIRFCDTIEGKYAPIVTGLPVDKLIEFLRNEGINC